MADLRFRNLVGHHRLGALVSAFLIGALIAPAAAQASGGTAVPGLSAVPSGAQSVVASALAQTGGANSAAPAAPSVPSVAATPVQPRVAVPAPAVSSPSVSPVKVSAPAVTVSVPAVKVDVSSPSVDVPAVDGPAGSAGVPSVGVPAVKVPEVKVPAVVVPAVKLPSVNLPAVVLSAPGARGDSRSPVTAPPASAATASARRGRAHPSTALGAHHLSPASGATPRGTGYWGERLLPWASASGPFALGPVWTSAHVGGHLSSTGGHRLAPVLRIVAVRRPELDAGMFDATAAAPSSPPVTAALPPGGAVGTAGGGGGAAGAVAAAILALAAVALLRALLPGLLAWDLLPWRSALLALRLERPG